MDIAQRKLAFQIQFWGLIGPLVASITLLVILIKSPPQAIYLSMATILGLVTSWKWKTKGAAVALSLMLVLYLYQFSEISPNEHLWHIGMNLAIVMGFAITALSLQEIEQLLHHAGAGTETKIVSDVEEVNKEEVNRLAKILEEKEAKINSYENLVETIKAETVKINARQEKLVEELLLKQHQLSTAEERNKLVVELEALIESKNKELEALKTELEAFSVQNPVVYDHSAMDDLKNTNELLSKERGRLESLLFRTQIDLHQKTQELADFPQLKLEMELKTQALQDAEYKEQELENRLYEQAKLYEEARAKTTTFEVVHKELQREIHEKDEKLKKLTQSLESIEKELQIKIMQKEERAADLHEKTIVLKEELLQRTEQLKEKHEKLQSFENLEKELQAVITEKEVLIAELQKKAEAQEEIRQQEIRQQEIRQQEIRQQDINQQVAIPHDLLSEFKKINGKYRQLREQFELKSEVLHETRKELFRKEESLSEANLKLHEIQIYGSSSHEAEMNAYILNLIQESAKNQQQQAQEIDELHAIITLLSKGH